MSAELALNKLPTTNCSSFSKDLIHESIAKVPANTVCSDVFLSVWSSRFCYCCERSR